jgi:hypothetical protein
MSGFNTPSAGGVSAGISTAGNTVGLTGLINNQLVIVGSDNITLSQSISRQSATLTILGATVAGGSFSAGVSNLSNDSGQTGTVANRLVLVGGNNITLSQATAAGGSATVTVIGPTTVAQSVQTQNMVSINGSTGPIVLTAGNNITLSENLSTITISAFNQSVQTQNMINAAAGTQTATSGTVVWSNSNNVSFGMSNSSIITATATFAQSIQPAVNAAAGTQTATSGTVVWSNSNNVSFGMSDNSVITATASFSQSVQPDQFNIIAAGTQTANTTQSVVFSNSNNVSFGMTNSSIVTATATFAQSVQPAVNLAAGTQTATSGTVVFSNSNNVSFGMTNSSIITASVADSVNIIAAGSQTGNTTGTIVFSNSNNVSFGMSNNSVVTATATFAAGAFSAGISVTGLGDTGAGNTCFSAVVVSQALLFKGGNNILLCESTNATNSEIATIEIVGPYFGTANNVTFGLSTHSLSINTTITASAGPGDISYFENFGGIPLITYQPSTGSLSLQRIYVPGNIIVYDLFQMYALSGDSGSTGSFSIGAALYGISMSTSSSTTGVLGTTSVSYSSTRYATFLSSASGFLSWTSGTNVTTTPQEYAGASGTQYLDLGPIQTTTAGTQSQWSVTAGEYIFGELFAQGGDGTISLFGLSSESINAGTNSLSTYIFLHKGLYSTSTTGFPSVIYTSEVIQAGASVLQHPHFFMVNWGTSSSFLST